MIRPAFLSVPLTRRLDIEPGPWMVSILIGAFTLVMAALALLGWQLDSDILKAMVPGTPPMKPNTAVCLCLLGAAVALSTNAAWSWRSRGVRVKLARAGVAGALLIAVLTVIEYVGGMPLGVDLWLFHDKVAALTDAHPGRMSPATTLVIGLLCGAMLLLDSRGAVSRCCSAIFALVALLVPFIAVLGYLYGARTLYEFPPYTSMAFLSALLLSLLATAVVFARPERAFVKELLSPHLGGLMARRMLPFVLIVPLAVGWLHLLGERTGLYGSDVGVAIFTVASTSIFGSLIWFAARQLNRVDADRRTADFEAFHSLRSAEARWRALIDASAQIVWTTDADGVALEDSPSWRAFTGQSFEQAGGAGCIEAIHPEDQARVRAWWQLAVASGQGAETEYRLRHVSQEWRWTSVRVAPIRSLTGCVTSWVGMNIDITPRKRAQALAEGQKNVLEMIARDAPLSQTLDTLVRLVDAQVEDMFCSILLLDADGKHLYHGAAPRLPESYTSAINGTAIGPQAGSCGTAAFTRRPVYVESIATDPLWRDFKDLALSHGLQSCWSTPILDGAGKVLGTFAIYYTRPSLPSTEHIRLIDLITQTAAICLTRHHATQKLRDSERRFRQLAESIPQLVWTCDAQGHTDYLSRQWVEFTGVPALDQRDQHWLNQLHPQDRDRVVQEWQAAVAARSNFHSEYRLRRHDGVYRWFDSRGMTVLDDAGRLIKWCGTDTDITDRKQLEESQIRSQKLEALGTLSGGIAHDFNNMLLVIAGNTQLAASLIDKDHAAQVCLQEIGQASSRAADLVRRILAFSRPQTSKHKHIEFQPVISEALRLVRSTLPAMIEIRTHLPPQTPIIAADATQVHQILVNLATNAAHAIGSQGGRIEVTLELMDVDLQMPARGPDLKPGRYARLSVRDDGAGMTPEVMARIFDPFFTTKPLGQGTGLGLSIVHGIMQSCAGAVRVTSELGKGTTFQLYFPVVSGEATDPTAAVPVLPGGGQHILLIDDEDALVRLGTVMLTQRGYRVTGCTDPVSAVKQFRRDPEQFHAVVTDLSMPGMSGFDCAREILQARPDVPIVLTSGYVRPEDEADAKRVGIHTVVTKPAALDQLPEILADVFRVRSA